MPIIKANAYGHGLREVMTILKGEKHAALGVAYGEEALRLRDVGYGGRVVALSFWGRHELPALIKRNIEIVVWDFASLSAVTTTAKRLKLKPKVHIKLDSGTSRIGFLSSDIEKLKKLLGQKNSFKIVGLFSHFASAEEQSTHRTNTQLKRFTTLDKQLGLERGVDRHIACTAAVLRYPGARFGLVRLGIGLYGLSPSAEIQAWSRANLPAVTLRPALTWYTHLAQIKVVPKGTGIGYGSIFIARRSMKIGVIPIGYADGYDRRLSNGGYVMIRGQRATIVGRICMNLCMVDVTSIPRAKRGDAVTIIGRGVSLQKISTAAQALNYELVTRINWSIPRKVI